MDEKTKRQVRELTLKGLTKEEIAKALKIEVNEIETSDTDLKQDSIELYSALQRDLTKLTFKEMNKDNTDSSVILNAIKLQAELQEKKLDLEKVKSNAKTSKNYIYERDEEIVKAVKEKSLKDVAKDFNISELSVKQSIDHNDLNLSEELKTLSPSIISETIGLTKNMRLKILKDAFEKNLTREDVRQVVIKIKNEQR
jgi:DNA-binding NarL/FixJ family response regulator